VDGCCETFFSGFDSSGDRERDWVDRWEAFSSNIAFQRWKTLFNFELIVITD
jgi:hypothetical protein